MEKPGNLEDFEVNMILLSYLEGVFEGWDPRSDRTVVYSSTSIRRSAVWTLFALRTSFKITVFLSPGGESLSYLRLRSGGVVLLDRHEVLQSLVRLVLNQFHLDVI